jgi:fibronectin type III domain protein
LQVKNKVSKETIVDYRIKNPAVTSYTLPFALNPEHTYQWKIKAQKPSGLYSGWVQITHQVTPGIPAPVFPEGRIDDLTPTLQWGKAEYAQIHRIIIQNADTREIVVNKIIKYDLSYTHNESLTSGNRYRWKVRAQSPDGEYSQWLYFEYPEASPPLPVTDSVTLTWGVPENRVDGSLLGPDDISQYIVEYQKEQEATKEITVGGVHLTELTLDNLSDGDYQFKIRAVDKMGLSSDFSKVIRVTLPRDTND